MKKSPTIPLHEYENVCVRLAHAFVAQYYCEKDDFVEDVSMFWVGDEVGSVLVINDDFWNMEDIVQAFRYNPTRDQLFKWHDQWIDEKNKEKKNLKWFVKNVP